MNTEVKTKLVSMARKHGVTIATVEMDSLTQQILVYQLQEELGELLVESRDGLVADFCFVTGHVTSELLGVLVGLTKLAKKHRKTFSICHVSGSLNTCLAITGLSQVIPSYPTLSEAVGRTSLGIPARRQAASRPPAERKSPVDTIRRTKAPTRLEQWYSPRHLLVGGIVICVITAWAVGAVRISRDSGKVAAIGKMPAEQKQFEVTLQGRVTFLHDGSAVPDRGALVVSWPDSFEPARRLQRRDVILLLKRATGPVAVTRTGTDGTYRLPAKAYEGNEGVNLVVISNHLAANTENDVVMQDLERVFVKPKSLMRGKQFSYGYFYVSPNRQSTYDVMFAEAPNRVSTAN